MDLFRGRILAISTKHHKEKVIAPLAEKHLKLACVVPQSFDTDIYGTFTGEIPRVHDPITTLRKKCLAGMSLLNADLGIASEGSFGFHSSIPFLVSNEEWVMFIDTQNNLEILAREISPETNYGQFEPNNRQELQKFATKSGFPSHGLILKGELSKEKKIFKDFQDLKELLKKFNELKDAGFHITAETDMRAMRNPTRMKNIENAVFKLLDKINSLCPKCSVPGFNVTSVTKGLPWSLCKYPTDSVKSLIFLCKNCQYQKEVKNPDGKTVEDPFFCLRCNP